MGAAPVRDLPRGIALLLGIMTPAAVAGCGSSPVPVDSTVARGAVHSVQTFEPLRSSGQVFKERREINVRPVQWHLTFPPGGRMVRIGISPTRWCVGTPKPRLEEVLVRESEEAVTLTAFRTHFPRSSNGACAALELGFAEVIELSRNLDGRELYDGSTFPPDKRWPRRNRD